MTALPFVLKSTVILATGLAAVGLARGSRAAVRHLILVCTFTCLAVMPLVAWLGTPVEVDLPAVLGNAMPQATDGESMSPASRSDVAARSGRPGRSIDGATRWLVPSALALWAAGMVTLLIPIGVNLGRLRTIRRHGLPIVGVSDSFAALACQVGIRRPIDVLTHEDVAAPMTMGFVRPAIVLPADACAWNTPATTRALVHELEHIRRSDWLIHVATRIVCAVYWFHPLTWVAWRALRLEAERACDDAVIQGPGDGTEYAEQLVALARRMTQATPGAVCMAKRTDLSRRVAAVLTPGLPRGRAGRFDMSLAIAASGALVLGIGPVTTAAQPRPGAAAVPTMAAVSTGGTFDDSLVTAAERGRLALVKALLDGGASANAAVVGEGSPLIAAARRGHVDVVAHLLERGADPNLAVHGDGSPLIAAARGGWEDVVDLLLDHGANPNVAVRGDGSPLIAAAERGWEDVSALLIERGAIVDQIVPDDENALIAASANGRLDTVHLLLDRGANANARVWADNGWIGQGEWRTPLSMARRGDHDDIVRLLQKFGARD